MRDAKLTLSVDPEIVESARRFAADHATSISQLVEDFLRTLTASPTQTSGAPVLNRLRGSLKDVDIEDYRQHLVEKYGCDESS